MKKTTEPSIFHKAVNFCSARARMAVDIANGFHDAYIDTCDIVQKDLHIRIKNIYFPKTRQYNSYHTDGVIIKLRLVGPVDTELFRQLNDRTIYSFNFQLNPASFTGDVQEVYDFKIFFTPEKSTLNWVFS